MSKYYLRVKQGTDKYISPWKISNIIEGFASEYYKKYVLNQLTAKMLDTTNNQIPIIFKSSFDLYQKYSKLKNFNVLDRDDIENLYYLGNLIPMTPHIKIKKVDLIFTVHRNIYRLLKKNEILMDRSKMLEYILPNFNDNPNLNFNALNEYVNSLIDEENSSLKQKCENEINNAQNNLTKYTGDSINFAIIDSLDEQEFDEYLKDIKNRNLYQKYYREFYKTYQSYARPIIAILDIESGNLEILAKEFIKEDLQEDNENKVEIKELAKNSPTVIGWIVGYIAASFIGNVFINALDNKRDALENDTSLEDESINPEVLRLRDAISRLQGITVNDEFNDNVVRLEDYKVRRGLRGVNDDIKRNVKDTFEKNEFLNSNIEISSVESTEEDDE